MLGVRPLPASESTCVSSHDLNHDFNDMVTIVITVPGNNQYHVEIQSTIFVICHLSTSYN